MSLDFRNTNLLWTSVLAETLYRLGLTTAILCPGSRSGPLTIAFAQHPHIEALSILDERSAAFFALGQAHRTGLPTVLVCTSGTAGANFYPAVIEAHESRVPMLLLTADRPPELRHCHAGQAIDQLKLFANAPNWQAELSLPSLERLPYLRQTIVQAWSRCLDDTPGPVHLNLPFRDPLAPLPEPEAQALARTFDSEQFWQTIAPWQPPLPRPLALPSSLLEQWRTCDRGLIIAGPAQPQEPDEYCGAIATLATQLNWPVLVEGLSPLRNAADQVPKLVTTYDFILRQATLAAQLVPDCVIRIGELPTSKVLRAWLQTHTPPQWLIDPSDHNLDPLHGPVVHLKSTPAILAASLSTHAQPQRATPYQQQWLQVEQQTRQTVDATLQAMPQLLECKVAWILAQHLPAQTPLFIANSMPVRDVEYFWPPNSSRIQPHFNRGGANGIDGTLSTALGVAHRHRPAVLLTGDLSLLHDTNGFLCRPQFQGHLTIVLINNHGGGIFGMLPIAAFEPPFEAYFATPQQVDFAQLAVVYGVAHTKIQSWDALVECLNPLPQTGIRVLEVVCDRTTDAQWRKAHFSCFTHSIVE